MRRDQRSAEAQSYRHLYSTSAWKLRRQAQLTAEPLCCMCAKAGAIIRATVADHVIDHKGDEAEFFQGELQSLCAPHHDRAKQRETHAGYSATAGDDGWPTDPRHPANRSR